MKIAYCIHSTYNSGGMERIVIEKANWLANHGHDVTIITTEQSSRNSFYPIDEKINQIDLNINYNELRCKSVLKKTIPYFRKQNAHKAKLIQTLITEHFDIVISTFGPEFPFLYKIKDGSRKIVEIHFSRHFRTLQFNRISLTKILNYLRKHNDIKHAKRYDRFVILTEEDEKNWIGCNNIIVIPNFTHPHQHISTTETHHAISVGRLTYQKGFDLLIKTWKEIVKYHPDWTLSIFGDGEDKDYLNGLIIESSLENNVNILKPTNNIIDQYQSASIYLLSSHYEGFPLVLCESMMAGLPSVAFACPCGPRDLIENGDTGFLVEPNDINGLAEKTIQLIESPILRKQMGQNARQRALKYFTPDVVMPLWIDLFNKVL